MKNASIPETHAWTICLSQWEPSEIKHQHWFFFFFLSFFRHSSSARFSEVHRGPDLPLRLISVNQFPLTGWFGHSTFRRPLNTIHVWAWNKSNCSNKLSHGHQSEKLTFIFPIAPQSHCISLEIANLGLISTTFFFLLSPFFLCCRCVLLLWAWRCGPQSFTILMLWTLSGPDLMGKWDGIMFCLWQFEWNDDLDLNVKIVRAQLLYSK